MITAPCTDPTDCPAFTLTHHATLKIEHGDLFSSFRTNGNLKISFLLHSVM